MAPLRHPPRCRSQHLTKDGRKEVTGCNRKPEPVTSQYATRRTRNAKPRLYYLAGTGVVGYRVADYLDQYGRHTRRDQLGPASLWDALTAHAASLRDLTGVAQAARDRGLYRHAAALWTAAVTLGSADAARYLIALLRQVSPRETTRAAQWAAIHVALHDPFAVARLLGVLRGMGAHGQVSTLLDRDPAAHASLNDSRAVASLLAALQEAGADQQVTALAARAASRVPLDNPDAVARLLVTLREAGADTEVAALAVRAPLDQPAVVACLLKDLRRAGAQEQVSVLLDLIPPLTPRSLTRPPSPACWLR